MSADYKKKVAKRMTAKTLDMMDTEEAAQKEVSENLYRVINDGEGWFMLHSIFGRVTIFLGKSPKSQKRSRIAA